MEIEFLDQVSFRYLLLSDRLKKAMFNETIRQLAAITDAAQFERIATSVLRSANPALYANISHQGVNTDGKTVKAPLDNIGWVRVDGAAMCVAGAHTTSSRDDLEGKWLHNPSTVKPRKAGKAPTQAPGDLVKAIGEIAELRKIHPNLKATLALTCNREEPASVRIKAEALADSANIVLDIWSVSRIAQYLDTTPEGQAIRHAYLGTHVELLSKEELLQVGTLSLTARGSLIDTTSLVTREIPFDGTGHVLLSGASGMGKSTICFEILRKALKEGRPGLVLDDQTIREATTIEEAIDNELRRYLPKLEPLSGQKALDFCTESEPFIVVVEDVSRAENTNILLNKLVSWILRESFPGTGNTRRKWRLLCPVWPRFVSGIEKWKEVNSAGIVHVIGCYSEDDALEAVKRRGEAVGRPLHDLAAATVARALGRDPLLIGLYDFAEPTQGDDVIAQYVRSEFDSAASLSGLTITDLEMAVNALLLKMLQQRRMTPTWREVQTWLGKGDDLAALRVLVTKGSVLRLTKSSGHEIIEPRHDRILHSLLAHFVSISIEDDLKAPYLSDPYFAEFVGTGASLMQINGTDLLILMDGSPLIAFYAFKHAVQSGNNYATTAAHAIGEWVMKEETRTPMFYTRRMLGLQILSEIDSAAVLELTKKFPSSDWHHPFFEAQFRNGDLNAALNWLTEYPFDTSMPGCHELIEHVRNKYGTGLVRAVSGTLKAQSLGIRAMRGALYLAGYLADPNLGDAVRIAWQQTSPSDRDLVAFLWAAARTCGDEPASTLGPVVDAWEALPDPEDRMSGNLTRSSLAAYGISWKFRDHIPRAALPYFVQRANESQALRWPITYMLRGIDDPVAVQHEVEFLAERSREVEDNGGIVDHFLRDEWRRLTEDLGRPMSVESKQRLLHLALDQDNDRHLRKRAFLLWEISIQEGDLAIARGIKADELLYNTAIWARARRRDVTVIPELIERIRANPCYWWQAGRYIWADDLTIALLESLRTLADSPSEMHESLGEWIFPELLLERLDLRTSERLLLEIWPKVRTLPTFFQLALCIATPTLVDLANEVVLEAADPCKLFEHISHTAGFYISGRSAHIRLAQLEAIRPHLKYLSELEICHLWDLCNERNWREFRKNHIDPVLLTLPPSTLTEHRTSDAVDMSDLDSELMNRQWRTHRWIEQQQRNGAKREDLFPSVIRWVQEKGNTEALIVAADIFSSDATRSEYELLEEVATKIDGHGNILAAIKFNVLNRTLV
ncbi:ATP-binding protein [Burkholderia ubonensis]|uniref:ATP-binding protein n=1 Tax=Burkholderia ubonensis TaxID=101571 RepID=UPI0012F7E276|nr:ATP-binding protein [Burkholderia ubonensis]